MKIGKKVRRVKSPQREIRKVVVEPKRVNEPIPVPYWPNPAIKEPQKVGVTGV